MPTTPTKPRAAAARPAAASAAHRPAPTAADAAPTVDVRMYCLGTGDCFVLKFHLPGQPPFTMMIDCGSCVGDEGDFRPYIENLAEYVGAKREAENGTPKDGKKTAKAKAPKEPWAGGNIDLLVVTHEHNDHVNGFAKCRDIFKGIRIKEAWFAWTEDPGDPDGKAQDLLKKREQMRKGFQLALNRVKASRAAIEKELTDDFYNRPAFSSLTAFLTGLQTLGSINLADAGEDAPDASTEAASGRALPGMTAIKALLKAQGTLIRYLSPGSTLTLPPLPGVNFHVLGPPLDKKYIFKDGKEGRDVYKRYFSVGEGLLAMNTFATLDTAPTQADLPFGSEYVLTATDPTGLAGGSPYQEYTGAGNKWRAIENEWLYSAGSLAIRLNSHINNTSLALAVEFGKEGKVMLLPGDAEYGSWESWHLIEKWNKAGKDGRHFVEDLLNRTVFYKVSHHLSYNGTALEKGIMMMNSPDMASMVTLDRSRISVTWMKTMPNAPLLMELNRRCAGKCFIMNEVDITANKPSALLNPTSLGTARYQEILNGPQVLAKQYTVQL